MEKYKGEVDSTLKFRVMNSIWIYFVQNAQENYMLTFNLASGAVKTIILTIFYIMLCMLCIITILIFCDNMLILSAEAGWSIKKWLTQFYFIPFIITK